MESDQSLALDGRLGAAFDGVLLAALALALVVAAGRFLTGEAAFFPLEGGALRRLPTADLDRLWFGFLRAPSALLRRFDFGA